MKKGNVLLQLWYILEEYSGEVEINDYMLLCTKTERLKMDKMLGFFGSNLF